MIEDYIRMTLQSLSRRRLRSWLTMLGIFIGIATIVTLISLGEGLKAMVLGQFSVLGPEMISVTTSQLGPLSTESPNPMGDKELRAIERVPGVAGVTPRNIGTSSLIFDDILKGVQVAEVFPGNFRETLYDVFNPELEKGRLLKDGDTGVIIVGNTVAHDSDYKTPIRVGDSVTMGKKDFKVIGILKKKGSFILDKTVLMNEDDYVDIMDVKNKEAYVMVGVKARDASLVKDIVPEIEVRLRKVRDVNAETQDFSVQAALDAIKQMESALFAVQLFIYIIAGISILVGGIGIANTMYASVLERTKDIGIMKAIGAKNSTVFTIFFIESGLLGLVGGAIGVMLGVLLGLGAQFIGKTILNTNLISAKFSFWLIAGSLLFSFLLGSLSGLLPTMQAAKMHPVVALRKAK